MPSRGRCWRTRTGRQRNRSESERRSGVLVILLEHRRIKNRPPVDGTPILEAGGGMEGVRKSVLCDSRNPEEKEEPQRIY